MEGYHKSVLKKEAVDALIPARLYQDGLISGSGDVWYLDCTLGDGGYTIEIIERGGRVIGIDVDPEAISRTGERLKRFGYLNKAILVQGNFRDIKNLIFTPEQGKQMDIAKSNLAGAIFDLGVSSLQLENPSRGFSFAKSGPIDMRMDPELQVTALDLLKVLSRKELYELFSNLGEEKYSRRIADAVVSTREVKQVTTSDRSQWTDIKTTSDLAQLVERVYRRMGIRDSRVHPATQVFQALRIAVNDELGALKEGLNQAIEIINKNGRIVVISFHSLEDRIVKNTFKDWEDKGIGKILSKKPVTPTEKEIDANPRSRSAKMRVFEKK